MLNTELPVHITTREAQIERLVLYGRSNLQIATELGISERTVKFHVTSVFKKRKVTSRSQLMAAEIIRLEDMLND